MRTQTVGAAIGQYLSSHRELAPAELELHIGLAERI